MTTLESIVAPGVARLKPYMPGKPVEELERQYGVSNAIKLASNENPLGASPKAVAAQMKMSTKKRQPSPKKMRRRFDFGFSGGSTS